MAKELGLFAAEGLEVQRYRLEYEYAKRFSIPTAVLFLEEEEQRFGKNPWTHGLEPNRSVLKKFVQYAHEQGYISSEPALAIYSRLSSEGTRTFNVQSSRFGSDNKIWLKANWILRVISYTLSLNLGVVQVLAFVASENSMFDSQFSLFTRTRLH